ncbi:MAG: hypothetical protein ACHQ1D_00120 [Nitrososphaerales archaeon]
MKIKFGLKQFSADNTPILAQKIGDIALLIAGVGVTIMTLPSVMAEAGINDFLMPPLLLKIAKACTIAGVVGKLLSKLVGAFDTYTDKPITTSEQKENK